MKTANNGSPGGGRGAAPMSDDTAEILRRFDLPAYLETEHGCKVQRSGDDKARCAATWRGGDGRNVALDRKGGKWEWYDHARGEGGDAITFLQAYEDLSQKEAWDRAREITGVRSSFDRATPGPAAPPKTPKPKADAKPESQDPKPVPFDPAELPLEKFKKGDGADFPPPPLKYPRVASVDVAFDVHYRPMALQVRYEPLKPMPGVKLPLPWTYYGGDTWKRNLGGLETGSLWFGLDDLKANPHAPVLIVEGPKARRGAIAHPDYQGWVVVSPFGGKSPLGSADVRPFKGRAVSLWPDADPDNGSQDAFRKLAEALARQATGDDPLPELVKLPPDLPPKWSFDNPAPEWLNVPELLQAAEVVGKPAESEPEPAPRRWVMSNLAEARSLAPVAWLVENTFREKGIILLYGKSGVGKSWTAIDLALSIATGTPWGPRETKRGRVLYLTLEDGKAGTSARADAWLQDRGLPEPLEHLMLLEDPVHLGRDEDVGAFIQEVRESGFSPDLIIFDTLALSMAGLDENTAKDAGAVIDNVKRIRRELDAAVMLIHHATKESGGEVYRGSTAWMGAVDTMMAAVEQLGGDSFTIKCTKQRSAPRFPEMPWKLEPVPGAMWGTTQMVTTRYLEDGSSESQAPKVKDDLTPKRRIILQTLERLTLEKDGSGPREIARETGYPVPTVQSALDVLKLKGYAHFDPDRKQYYVPRMRVRKPFHTPPPPEGVKNGGCMNRMNVADESFIQPIPFNGAASEALYEVYENPDGEFRTGEEVYVCMGVLKNPIHSYTPHTPDLEKDPEDDGEEV